MALAPMEFDEGRETYSGTVNVPAIPANGYAEVSIPKYTNNLVCMPWYYSDPKYFNCMIRSVESNTSYVVRVNNSSSSAVSENAMKLCWIQA